MLFSRFGFSQSEDTIYFKEDSKKLSYSFTCKDIKEILKNNKEISMESLLKFNTMIDSVSNSVSKQITEDDILKFRNENTDFLHFDKAIYSLIKKGRVEFKINEQVISRSELKIKKRFITCCHSLPRLLNNWGCCSKRNVFYYKNEIVGTLYIKWFPKLINCI